MSQTILDDGINVMGSGEPPTPPTPPRPEVLSLSPTTGPAGTEITVTGVRFTSVVNVTVGASRGEFTAIDDTSLTVVVPDGLLPGEYAVQVTTISNGSSQSDVKFTVTAEGGA